MRDVPDTAAPKEDAVANRDRILAAAAELLKDGGRDRLTTRAVATAAGVQAPTLYRLFGDKSGLLDAVADQGFERYVQQKQAADPDGDPVDRLRSGWDLHVGFGLAHPALFAIMYGDPRPGSHSPASTRAIEMLRARMRVLASAGRLRVPEERATELVRAAGCGTVFILLTMPEAKRDLGVSVAAREAIIAAIVADPPKGHRSAVAPAAVTLRALLPQAEGLSEGERALMAEWLERIAST